MATVLIQRSRRDDAPRLSANCTPSQRIRGLRLETKTKVAVVGAGQMGVGIAHAFANSGHPTALADVSQTQLDKAMVSIAAIFGDGVRLGKITGQQAESALARLSPGRDLATAATGADLLVETASEALPLKHSILKEAEQALSADAIIGTNTSALGITEIAAVLHDPSRCIGMHFFNPVHRMKLVELVLGLNTSTQTLARTRAYSDALGKTSIVVNESPGLTTSRMSAMAGNEAMWMLLEGTAAAEDIDTALRLGFNHPMGPLELGDLTGWDTRLNVLRHLHQTLGDKFRPCPLLVKMVAAGRLGQKVGWGVYRYENGQKVPGSGLKASAF